MKLHVQGSRTLPASAQDAPPGVTVKDRVQIGGHARRRPTGGAGHRPWRRDGAGRRPGADARRFNIRPDSRFLMLWTPNGGSHAMALALLGRGMTVKALAATSLSQSLGDITGITGITGIIRACPGAVQLFPDYLLNPATWPALSGRPPPTADALKAARDFRARMRDNAGIPVAQTRDIAGLGLRHRSETR